MAASFLKAVFAEAVNNPNYFNGKVLTARDLRDEQTANRLRARRLGQAIGEGVAAGLFVEASGDNLTVSAGVAVNRLGDVLTLPAEQTLELSPTAPSAAGAADSPFRPCVALPTVTPINAGLYLLALTLASDMSRELAPHSGLNEAGPSCLSRYEAQGVQFKLVPIESAVFSVGSLDTASTRLLQSRLAAGYFGLGELAAQAATPFAAPDSYGIVDALRERGELAPCDVPLATLRYAGGLRFVDTWAVRRPCHTPLSSWPLDGAAELPEVLLPQHLRPRRAAEAAAMLMQFQAQLAALQPGAPHTVKAREHFAFLPAAGYLPSAATLAESTARRAFWWGAFFGDHTLPLNTIDPAFLRAVFADSLYVDPIILSGGAAPPVDLFQVSGAPADKPLIVFVRREPIVLRPAEPAAAEPEPEPEPERPAGPGTLLVAVKDRAGKLLLRSDVEGVAVAEPGGKTVVAQETEPGLYSSAVASVDKRYYKAQATSANQRSYAQAYKALTTERAGGGGKVTFADIAAEAGRRYTESVGVAIAAEKLALYRFTLPPGAYVVGATPADKRLLTAASDRVVVVAGGTTSVELRFTPGRIIDTGPVVVKPKIPPYEVFDFDDRFVLPGGDLIDQIYVDLDWGRGGDFDPPREWEVALEPEVRESIEQTLGGWLVEQPGMASMGAGLYVNPAYSAGGAPSEEPYAFIGTRDGGFFPVVLVGGQHKLNGDVPATRGGLADIGAEEFNATLRGGALEKLDALTGAWGGLLADTLGIDTRGATALVSEARGAATALQASFARYPGVDAGASAALGQKYQNDADLANATPTEVLAQLNTAGQGAYSIGFATRLVERARANVPPAAWSIDTVAADAGTKARLAEMGVESKGELNNRIKEGSAAELQGELGLSDSSFNNLVSDVQSALVAGAVRLAPDAGVAAVEGVSRDQAAMLVAAGVASTGAGLARASREEVASTLNISVEEAGQIIGNAAAKTGELGAFTRTLGLEESAVAEMQGRGVVSLADLAVADPGALSAAIGEAAVRGVGVAGGALERDIGFRMRFG